MAEPLSLPISYKRTTTGPDIAWYSHDDGTPYANDAEACASVPQGVRLWRTVLVAGIEKYWGTDTSDLGLKEKVSGGANPYMGAFPAGTSTAVKKNEVWLSAAGVPYVAKSDFTASADPAPGAYWGLWQYVVQGQLSALQTQVSNGAAALIKGSSKAYYISAEDNIMRGFLTLNAAILSVSAETEALYGPGKLNYATLLVTDSEGSNEVIGDAPCGVFNLFGTEPGLTDIFIRGGNNITAQNVRGIHSSGTGTVTVPINAKASLEDAYIGYLFLQSANNGTDLLVVRDTKIFSWDTNGGHIRVALYGNSVIPDAPYPAGMEVIDYTNVIQPQLAGLSSIPTRAYTPGLATKAGELVYNGVGDLFRAKQAIANPQTEPALPLSAALTPYYAFSGHRNTDTLAEGSTNKYFTNARAIGSLLTGYVKSGTSRALSTVDSILTALGVLEKKTDDNAASLLNKANLLTGRVPYYELPLATNQQVIAGTDGTVLVSPYGLKQAGISFGADTLFGDWDPATNTPYLVSSGPNNVKGTYYRISRTIGPTSKILQSNAVGASVTVTNAVGLFAGMRVTGAGIRPNTTIYSISGNSLALSDNVYTGEVLAGAVLNFSVVFGDIASFTVDDYLWCNGSTWKIRKFTDGSYYNNPKFQQISNTQQLGLLVSERYVYNVRLTLIENKTFFFLGLVEGSSGSIWVTQDATGSRTVGIDGVYVDLGSGSYRIDPVPSVNLVQPNPAANSVTEMSWFWDGLKLYWNNKQY